MESMFRPPFKTTQKVEELNRSHEIIKVADSNGRIACEVRRWPNEKPLHFRRRAQAVAKALTVGSDYFNLARMGLVKEKVQSA